MPQMEMKFKIKEPRVGMRVVSKTSNCCLGMNKGELGRIVKLSDNGLEFTVEDWKDEEWLHCVQCSMELRPVTKEEWKAICDAETAKPRRRR